MSDDVIDLRAFRQLRPPGGEIDLTVEINYESLVENYRVLADRMLRDYGRAGLDEIERTLLPNVARLVAMAPPPPIRVRATDALLFNAIEHC